MIRFLLATTIAASLTMTLAAQVQKKDVPGISNTYINAHR